MSFVLVVGSAVALGWAMVVSSNFAAIMSVILATLSVFSLLVALVLRRRAGREGNPLR